MFMTHRRSTSHPSLPSPSPLGLRAVVTRQPGPHGSGTHKDDARVGEVRAVAGARYADQVRALPRYEALDRKKQTHC